MYELFRQIVPNVYYLNQLRGGNLDAYVIVKVLRRWNLPYSSYDVIRKMILADEKGNKIDATIPPRRYDKVFNKDVIEGEWYVIKKFRVHRVLETEKYADNEYQISLIKESTMLPAVQNLSASHFFDFVHFSSIIFDLANKSVCHDAFGVVVKVGNFETIDHAHQNDLDPETRTIEIQLKDSRGFYMKCIAIGVHCDQFISLWRNLGYDCGYKWLYGMDPVMCVLRFFRISNYRGQTCLRSDIKSSQMFLNGNFFLEDEIEAYLNGFLYNVQADEI